MMGMLLVARTATAQGDTTTRVWLGAFVDTYYAYDFGRPRSIDRAFTTQAARHSEFNVNLAYLDARVAGPRVRGRLAVQGGTSVQVNYAGEPRIGSASGPELTRLVQEATVGYQLAARLWIDAGIFFAPFGSESWISADNWTYTRSLVADNSPYYESGAKATWRVRNGLDVQLHVMNGWQNISENNAGKALGFRVDYAPHPRVSLGYDAFAGNEQPDTSVRALRVFHEFAARARLTSRIEMSGTLDYGTQQLSETRPQASWRGWALLAQLALNDNASLTGRVEWYSDPRQIIVQTGQAFGLRARGASVNVDVRPSPLVLCRLEARVLDSPDRLFSDDRMPNRSTRNWAIVSSMAFRTRSHS